jgi:hypothetical protein
LGRKPKKPPPRPVKTARGGAFPDTLTLIIRRQEMAKFQKINVTYHAPEGDNKVVEMMNMTFFDGQAVDMIGAMSDLETLENNPHFQVNSHTDYDPGDHSGAAGKLPGPVPVPPAGPAHQPGHSPAKSDKSEPKK